MSARETALNVLIACRKQAAWSNGVLKEYIARDQLDRRDAALATRLCYGVLQNRSKLDFYLKQLLTGKLKDLHPVVHDILHLGIYQIYEMDKIPASAAVNESVALAKKYCKKLRYAPGLVNAVLRSAVRTMGTLREPVSLEDRYSHPQALIDLLRKDIGEQRLETMLAANNAMPQTVVQVNTQKISTQALMERLAQEEVTAQPHRWMADCLVLGNTGNLEKLPAFREGLFYVQDAASRLAIRAAGPEPGMRVLDCCAAPGGKSFATAIALQDRGEVISCDIHPHKKKLIQAGADRLGMDIIKPMTADGKVFRPEWEQAFDLVVVDAPCSGLGVIRKKPDIRYKDPAPLEDLPAIQSEILANASRYVKPGGVLLYSTCTLLRRENEAVVLDFLGKHSGYKPEPFTLPGPVGEVESGMVTLWPHRHGTDGFFICKLRKGE